MVIITSYARIDFIIILEAVRCLFVLLLVYSDTHYGVEGWVNLV